MTTVGPVLVVTAVAAERDAILAGLPAGATVTVDPVGVGPAAAAAGTARLLALAEAAGHPYRTVISAGIAGGFTGRAPVGAVVLASRTIQADLGADSQAGFLPLDQLDLGAGSLPADEAVLAVLRTRLPGALVGDVLTVATVTGTAARAATLAATHPAALAEAMEGYGVACAAAGSGAAFAELRAISNLVGPRDRSAWRIGEALAALTAAAASLRKPRMLSQTASASSRWLRLARRRSARRVGPSSTGSLGVPTPGSLRIPSPRSQHLPSGLWISCGQLAATLGAGDWGRVSCAPL